MRLRGNVALVTGASRGLGSEIARALGRAGMSMALVARGREGLESIARTIGEERTLVVPADLADPARAREAVESVLARFGRIDVLVNSAGLSNGSDFLHSDPEALARTVDVNLRATVVLTRLVAEGMAARGAGHIVNISSVAGITGMPGEATYAATKAAIRLFTSSLRPELTPRGIHLTDVVIGPMTTGMLDSLEQNHYTRVMFDRGRKLGVVKDVRPEDVAAAAVRAIQRQQDVVILPARSRFIYLPFQGLARTVAQLLTPRNPDPAGKTH